MIHLLLLVTTSPVAFSCIRWRVLPFLLELLKTCSCCFTPAGFTAEICEGLKIFSLLRMVYLYFYCIFAIQLAQHFSSSHCLGHSLSSAEAFSCHPVLGRLRCAYISAVSSRSCISISCLCSSSALLTRMYEHTVSDTCRQSRATHFYPIYCSMPGSFILHLSPYIHYPFFFCTRSSILASVFSREKVRLATGSQSSWSFSFSIILSNESLRTKSPF